MTLRTTPAQDQIIKQSMSVLTEEEVADCEEEASEIAGYILNSPRAADDLTRTLIQVILRNAEEPGGLL